MINNKPTNRRPRKGKTALYKANTGLGMPICVKIIESHGGKLEISSDESLGGACFSFAFIDNEDSMKERSYTE